MADAAGYADFSYACFNNQSVAWAGYLNSIVEQPQIGGVFYNKDVFDACNITKTPTTWAEFLTTCETLEANGYEALALDGAYANFNFYYHLVRHLGEDGIKELGLNGGWAANEAAVAAAQETIDLGKRRLPWPMARPMLTPPARPRSVWAPPLWSSAPTTLPPRLMPPWVSL